MSGLVGVGMFPWCKLDYPIGGYVSAGRPKGGKKSSSNEHAAFISKRSHKLTPMQMFIVEEWLVKEKELPEVLAIVRKKTVETVTMHDIEISLMFSMIALSEEEEQVH